MSSTEQVYFSYSELTGRDTFLWQTCLPWHIEAWERDFPFALQSWIKWQPTVEIHIVLKKPLERGVFNFDFRKCNQLRPKAHFQTALNTCLFLKAYRWSIWVKQWMYFVLLWCGTKGRNSPGRNTKNKKFGFLFLSTMKIKPNKMAIISINTFENSNTE